MDLKVIQSIMIWICILLLCFQHFVEGNSTVFSSFAKLQLPPNVIGPEALAFDARGEGPYTGVADGRILKHQGPGVGFLDYAVTSPFRTKQQCDGTNGSAASICGRPAGLGFNLKTGQLYVVDLFFGFLAVPPGGGLATQLATGFNGTTFELLNALDIDQANQIVYFTDSGRIFLTMNQSMIIQSNDTSGKLYKYDITTQTLSLLLSELSGPAGVAVSKNGEYVLIDEFIALRVRRYWVRGPKAGSTEILANLPGSPDNIKRTISGDFFAAVTIFNLQTFQTISSVGQKIDGDLGIVVATVNLTAQYTNYMISEVQEFLGKLYIGSATADFVGVYGPSVPIMSRDLYIYK